MVRESAHVSAICGTPPRHRPSILAPISPNWRKVRAVDAAGATGSISRDGGISSHISYGPDVIKRCARIRKNLRRASDDFACDPYLEAFAKAAAITSRFTPRRSPSASLIAGDPRTRQEAGVSLNPATPISVLEYSST